MSGYCSAGCSVFLLFLFSSLSRPNYMTLLLLVCFPNHIPSFAVIMVIPLPSLRRLVDEVNNNLYKWLILMFILCDHSSNLFFLHASLSGQCDLRLCWASFCRCDIPWPSKLPSVAGSDGVLSGGLVRSFSVQDVEQGGTSAHLWPPPARWCVLAVPKRGQTSTTHS